MKPLLWFPSLILFYAAVSAYGLYLLKASEHWKSMTFVLGFGLYGAGFLIWIFILRMFPLSIAFPAAAGALILATQIAGIIYLKEPVHASAMAGIGFIAIGIILIYSSMATHDG
ncbi:MAG: hypothetical protein C9356_18360 [Oleiphilus sp.]|nr:MAG: hypothetical protein C9356_18360 [Oleiphilus sp.]